MVVIVLAAAVAVRPYAALHPDPASSGVGVAKKLGPGPDADDPKRRRKLTEAVATEALAAAGAFAGAPALRPPSPLPQRLTFLSLAKSENGLTLFWKAAESVVIEADLSNSERPPLPMAPQRQNRTPRRGSPFSTDSRTRL